jgi:hypothetical protein
LHLLCLGRARRRALPPRHRTEQCHRENHVKRTRRATMELAMKELDQAYLVRGAEPGRILRGAGVPGRDVKRCMCGGVGGALLLQIAGSARRIALVVWVWRAAIWAHGCMKMFLRIMNACWTTLVARGAWDGDGAAAGHGHMTWGTRPQPPQPPHHHLPWRADEARPREAFQRAAH